MATNELGVSRTAIAADVAIAKPSILSSLRGRSLSLSASLFDQALSVGGMFLANVALARVQSREEYGLFALSYSIFSFLLGIHNATILEPFTVLASGRYQAQFGALAKVMWRSNFAFCAGLSGVLIATWLSLRWLEPGWASPSLLGMASTCGVLLTGAFVRRTFYIVRNPGRAASLSLIFFVVLGILLITAIRGHWLSAFTTFVVAATAWVLALSVFRKAIPGQASAPSVQGNLLRGYGAHHWQYARWMLATAFVFQLMTQGYYWIVAGFLSVRDVAALRAVHLLVVPIDQVFTALNMLILPVMAARYATGQHQALSSLWFRFTMLFLGITVPFAVMVRLFSRTLLHGIYGGKFDDLAATLGLLALAPVIMGIGNSTSAALKSIECPNAVFLAFAGSGIVTLAAGIPLVMHFYLRGAVYGMLASAAAYTTSLLIAWFVYRNRIRVHESALFS
jgi:O-antigen/teichoic acid export membrane protein